MVVEGKRGGLVGTGGICLHPILHRRSCLWTVEMYRVLDSKHRVQQRRARAQRNPEVPPSVRARHAVWASITGTTRGRSEQSTGIFFRADVLLFVGNRPSDTEEGS
eukprot:TRINITY_DN30365_c0_g1_i2.p6 TRINITY_DN30365_c0_g1~~TRINITY_DN30365_c0_g1_i2.p6  ORF type:complete len:106 (-),score=0.96 TRINITY_DN30365_c0_g1_i2:653-970(-)